ncbi:MAG: hypothetical protein TREMPRED_001937, partial [Tremellales sp. Tagirdzhanova-0007]
MYPSAILPAEFSTRLLRLSLHKLAPLLEPSPLPAAAKLTNGGGKRGKKRVRGAEDGLVGGLEGREGRAVSSDEIEVILESLELTPLLHPTPLLSSELLTFSIRLHLSLHVSIPSLETAHNDWRIPVAVTHVLEEALLINEAQSGTSSGWKTVVLSVL